MLTLCFSFFWTQNERPRTGVTPDDTTAVSHGRNCHDKLCHRLNPTSEVFCLPVRHRGGCLPSFLSGLEAWFLLTTTSWMLVPTSSCRVRWWVHAMDVGMSVHVFLEYLDIFTLSYCGVLDLLREVGEHGSGVRAPVCLSSWHVCALTLSSKLVSLRRQTLLFTEVTARGVSF